MSFKKTMFCIDQALLWGIGVLGIPFTVYGMLFQTECFKWVSISSCALPFAIGTLIALFMMNYLYQQSKDMKQGGKRVVVSGLRGMANGYAICFIACMIMVYTAREVSFFLLGIGGMMISCVSILYFVIWYTKEEKKKKLEHADSKNG